MITEEFLSPYREQLRCKSARERDSAAEWLADHLQHQPMTHATRVTAGLWLFEALRTEPDDTVMESLAHAIGVSNLCEPCPEWPWQVLAERMPQMRLPVLIEYGIETLGQCGDPAMIAYLDPYREDPHEKVRTAAAAAIELLNTTMANEATAMESPDSWDLLTAGLAVSDLSSPELAWAFLVVQGLVRDQFEDRRTFVELIREERERGSLTGPTLEARVAARLFAEGIGLAAAKIADPNAKEAMRRRELIESWRTQA